MDSVHKEKTIGTLKELLKCFSAWDSDCRVLGNVKAGDAVEAINLEVMYANELQEVAQIVHHALGWYMIQGKDCIYARDMVQELADKCEEQQRELNRNREAIAVFDSFLERFNLSELLKQHIDDGRPTQ